MYTTYESPFAGRTFTEYPTYEGWIYHMTRSGVYEEI